MTQVLRPFAQAARLCLPLLAWAPLGAAFAAPAINFANYPLFLAPPVLPNVLIMFDNSQSMDATMSGMVISGDDPTTRGNIARTVLRGILDTYKDAFNWGLGSFEAPGASLYITYPYWLGSSTKMVYTNDCVAGISASNAGLRCIANPEPANGFNYITYERSGDDADINDVFYWSDHGAVFYGVGTTGHSYGLYASHKNTTGWATSDFTGSITSVTFTPTDAGYAPGAVETPRAIFTKRGWGYLNNITGKGKINEKVAPYSMTHFNTLNTLLANETNGSTGEIKNNAVNTPLTGTLKTANDYFSKGLSSSQKSPVSQTCQKNFIILATDGNPTGKTDGSMYDPSQWASSYDASTGTWTYGQAQLDVFAQITALRAITLSGSNLTDTTLAGRSYDVQTYIVGMGDSVANPSAIAAMNRMAELGGGNPTAFLGSDSSSLIAAFQAIVGNIQSKASAASSVALNSGSWNTGAAVYQAKFSSADWSGDLVALAVASDGTLASTPSWRAADQVNAQNWNTGRAILTYKPSAAAGAHGIPFRWPVVVATPTATELDTVQTTALNKNASGATDGNGQLRLKYLRGDPSQEVRNCGACTVQFRSRPTTVLGDIVNSSPYYVGAPAFGYYDDFEAAAYSAFVSTYRTRTPVIYSGANDGMLHAFNANTGAELFAYVPSSVIAATPKLTASTYAHQYFVDGSPTTGDVFYGGAWHTLLVSGLRAGGKGLFALDITNPANFSEANASSIVRWEFQDADMGYVFGQPLLVKANTGRWVVIVSGGYKTGSATGHAMLFVIDAETGALVKKIDTGAGTPASPNGLSAAAAIDINGDAIADVVYAGDLNGNLWKFNLTSSSAAAWSVGNGGAPLFTTQTNQPIVDRPDVTKFPQGGYLVTFGTGRYMDTVDIALPVVDPDPNPNNSTQSVYGVWDNLGNTTVPLSDLQQQSIVAVTTGPDGYDYRLSTYAVGTPSDALITGDNVLSRAEYYSTKRGWYLNLPTGGERVVSDPRFRGGRVVFTTLIPDASSPCAFGGSGWVLEFDAITGNRLDSATFDSNADNGLSTDDYLLFADSDSSSKLNTSGRKISAIPAAPGFMGNKNGKANVEDKFINTSDGSVVRVRETAGKGGEGRVMWRELK